MIYASLKFPTFWMLLLKKVMLEKCSLGTPIQWFIFHISSHTHTHTEGKNAVIELYMQT